MSSGQSGLVLSRPLGIDYKPVTRVENFCATGSEAFRNACYAVASGAYDVVMAVGVEKLKDSGYSGLVRSNAPSDGTAPGAHADRARGVLAARPGLLQEVRRRSRRTMREAMTHVAWKNHVNGAKNPRAQFRKEVPKEKIAATAGTVAGRLGVFDCSGVSDGAACALIVRAEDAHQYTDTPMYVKALVDGRRARRAARSIPSYDYTTFHEVVRCAQDAYRRPASTTRARRSRSPRSTTASPRPSSC